MGNQNNHNAAKGNPDAAWNRQNGSARSEESAHIQDVAVFFDFENIVYSTRNCLNVNPDFGILMDCCRSLGRVVIARAYADWRRHAPAVSSILHNQDIDPVFVPSYQYGRSGSGNGSIKNSVDMHLCVDAMRVLYRYPHLNTFVLISGDRDFIPLVRALRMEGKTVIGVGVADTTSNYLGRTVDQFIFYQDLVKGNYAGRPAATRSEETADEPSAAPEAAAAPASGEQAAIVPGATPVPDPPADYDDALWDSLLDDADARPV